MVEAVNEDLKIAAARAALDFIRSEMIVGLGTGSTTEFFIDLLIEKSTRTKLNIKVVPSSFRSAKKAKEGKFAVLDINEVVTIDIVVDGADEIDDQKNMIKGGGGALLREKILALAADKMIVIADKSKMVEQLGKRAIPVEIIPYGYKFTMKEFQKKGFIPFLRLKEDGSIFLTDNNNYIFDVKLDSFVANPKIIHERMISITGVIETGLFYDLDPILIIASDHGEIKIIQ